MESQGMKRKEGGEAEKRSVGGRPGKRSTVGQRFLLGVQEGGSMR